MMIPNIMKFSVPLGTDTKMSYIYLSKKASHKVRKLSMIAHLSLPLILSGTSSLIMSCVPHHCHRFSLI